MTGSVVTQRKFRHQEAIDFIGRRVMGRLVAATFFVASSGMASAQSLPSPIKIIVGLTPGGPVDLTARQLASALQARTGATVIVENRAGANGLIAADVVKRSDPDGKTILITGQGLMTITPHLDKNTPFDPLRDLAPIAAITYSQTVLVADAKLPAKNLKEFLALAASSKPLLRVGHAGVGNITNLLVEQLKMSTKTDYVQVPYSGSGDMNLAVIKSEVAATFTGLAPAFPQIKAGTMTPLAVVGTRRSNNLPDVPTFTEAGIQGFESWTWTGLYAAKGTKPEVLDALSKAIEQCLSEDSELKARLMAVDLTPWFVPGPEVAKMITTESERWKQLITEQKLSTAN